jgi:hypothetical protein
MKRTITTMAFALGLITAGAQVNIVTDFETFTLSPNSAYSPTTSTPFQTTNAIFDYQYAGYWSAGFAYTNKKDSVNGTFTNLYGVRAYNGYAGSDYYATGQDRGKITLTVPQSTVGGFYITNTTYAYKSVKSGDSFARRFGDTTGTGSGTTIPQGSYPDYFKVIVKGYKNGVLKNDSVTVMLADYTFTNNAQDFVLDTWQFVNTAIIGEVDSIKFFMRSTDMASWGMNTPGFFAIDNFTVIQPTYVGIAHESANIAALDVYPNPFGTELNIGHAFTSNVEVRVNDLSGKTVYVAELSASKTKLDLTALQSGVYFLQIRSGKEVSVKKIIKE